MTAPDDGSIRITPGSGTNRTTTTPASATTSRTTSHTTTTTGDDVTGRMAGTSTIRPTGDGATGIKHKTSAAAVFALVFGLAALFCALTAILSPAAVLFGVIGLILGVVALKMVKRPGVHGKGVAIGGLVTALLGLLLGGAVLGGLAAVVNDNAQLDRISNKIDDLRAKLPSTDEVKQDVQESTD